MGKTRCPVEFMMARKKMKKDAAMNSTDAKTSNLTREIVSDRKKKKVFCEVCNISLDERFLQLHLRGQKHNRKQLNLKVFKPIDPRSLKQTKRKIIEPMKQKGEKVFCFICDITITQGNIPSHLKGKKHMNQLFKKKSDKQINDEGVLV